MRWQGVLFFFKQKTAYELSACLVGAEMCIRDRPLWDIERPLLTMKGANDKRLCVLPLIHI